MYLARLSFDSWDLDVARRGRLSLSTGAGGRVGAGCVPDAQELVARLRLVCVAPERRDVPGRRHAAHVEALIV